MPLSVLLFFHRWLWILYAACGALIFALFIVFDTQQMIGSKGERVPFPEEYIFVTLVLYMDIIDLFRYVLYLVAACTDG